MTQITINPFRGLSVVQNMEDLDRIDAQFTGPLKERQTCLICDECGSTTMKYRVIVEADMIVDVGDSVINMTNEKVQAVKVLCCGACDSSQIKIYKVDGGVEKKETERLIPRMTGV